jgi:serine phosphatase RsbU (regulator of sigma subunit)
LRVEVAAAKVGKWAMSESGDTLEMIERPRGGLSLVLVDGQRSGRAAKAISNLVARKAISELAEGVRDGAAARAAHDYLHAYKGGKVLATLNIVSVDLVTNTLVLSRNNPCPSILVHPSGEVQVLDEDSKPVGIYLRTKPVITEVPLESGLAAVVYTDGLQTAGERRGGCLDLPHVIAGMLAQGLRAREIADRLLDSALEREEHRPRDDISVVVLQVRSEDRGGVRKLSAYLPIS